VMNLNIFNFCKRSVCLWFNW